MLLCAIKSFDILTFGKPIQNYKTILVTLKVYLTIKATNDHN